MDTFHSKLNSIYGHFTKDSKLSTQSLHIVTQDMIGNVYIFILIVTSISHGHIGLHVRAFNSWNTKVSK